MLNKGNLTSRQISIISIMSVLLIVGKFALSFIPNVEVVTLMVISFSYVFGPITLFSTLIFCTMDIILYPPSLDVIIAYYIYWNSLSLITIFLKKMNIKSENIYLIFSLFMTFLFGVLTSFLAHLLFKLPFKAVYLAGIVFYVVHITSTLATMFFAFRPLVNLLEKIKNGDRF